MYNSMSDRCPQKGKQGKQDKQKRKWSGNKCNKTVAYVHLQKLF